MTSQTTTVLSIDRSTPFNPARFLSTSWTIWRGPTDGTGFDGDEAQDERSLALTEVDLATVRFETCLKEGERRITGEERLTRLQEKGYIRLDANTFRTLWQNQHLIPERWKEPGSGSIFFDGTILRSPRARRPCVLCLYWDDGQWHWYLHWIRSYRSVNDPSAALAR